MKKIIIVGPNIEDPDRVGGITSVIQCILSEINIDYKYFSRSPDLKDKGIRALLFFIKKVLSFTKLCKRYRPAIVHIHTALNPTAITRDLLWVLLAKSMGIPVLLHLHGGKFLFDKPSKFLLFVINTHFFLAKRIIVLSDTEKDRVSMVFPKYSRPIDVVENAVQLDDIPNLSKVAFNLKQLKLIFLGRICESKGVEDLAEALEHIHDSGLDFMFNLYGQGELQESIIQRLQSSLNDKFQYHGIVRNDDKWEALNKNDVFLLPSRHGEGLPIALLEAMAVGKIVVATDDASIGVVLKDGYNGFIVDKYSPQSIVDVIQKISNFDRIEIQDIQKNAIKTIKENYTSGVYYEKLQLVYNKF